MKTDALSWVIRFAKGMRDGQSSMRISEEAGAELKALEESHADMARALMAFYRSGHACREDETQCLHCTAAAALRKAGVL